MNKLFKRYIENQNKLNTLKDAYLKSGLVNQEVLGEMVSIAALQRRIFEENSEILQKTVYYYDKNREELNDCLFKDFQDFANKLALLLNQKDTAIAYMIHEFLLEYAIKVDNPNYIVQEAYYKASVLLYLDSDLFHKETHDTYSIVLKYKDMYFDLDKETRKLFNRAYGNIFVTLAFSDWKNYKEIINTMREVQDFWLSEKVQLNDIDFPFYRWIFLSKNNFLDFISTDTFASGVEDEYIELALEYATEVYTHAKTLVKDTSLPVEGLPEYYYYAANYYAGKISFSEFLNKVEFLSYPLPDNRYSLESRTRAIQIGAYYIKLLSQLDDKKHAHELINDTIARVKNYISEMPFSSDERQITSDIEMFINAIADKIDEKEAFKIILELTVYCHFPTYVHITMVANIALAILKVAIKEIPEYFVGMAGIKEYNDVFNKVSYLEDIAYNASLLHDVGKFYCLDYIGNFGRKLTDKEFEIIKSHPLRGYKLLRKARIPDKYIESALYHHKWYDGTYGYPNTDSEIIRTKPIIDIITLADAIDAATDTLGRPYAKGKRLSDLLAEFDEGAGTRYSKDLVRLLHYDSLKKELEKLITDERENISIRTHKNFTRR